jgi:hypothetical protein
MIEEQRKITLWHDKDGATYGGTRPMPKKSIQGWNPEYLGSILGRNDIDSERHPFESIYGKLAGFGTIGEQNVILIDMRDKDGYHVLLPAVVYKDGVTLVKGTKCLVGDMNYSNKHDGNPLFILPEDIELTSVPWNNLFDKSKKIVYVQGGYGSQLANKFGIPAIFCFSPTLNLEMADAVVVTPKTGTSSPWTEK